MRKHLLLLAAIMIICSLCSGCAKKTEGNQVFKDGFVELKGEDGALTPPGGIKWGASMREVADAHGLALNDENWTIFGELSDGKGKQTMSAKAFDKIKMFDKYVHCVYDFENGELYHCWYQFFFYENEASEALDFAKTLERGARDAFGGDTSQKSSIRDDIESIDEIWALRRYEALWNFTNNGDLQLLHIAVSTNEAGKPTAEAERLRENKLPSDLMVDVIITSKTLSY